MGINKVQERLKQLQKTHKDKELKLRRGELPGNDDKPSEYDSLVRKMQQQMLIISGDVMQSMYDSYQSIVNRYI